MRVPWEEKRQHASIRFIDPASAAEREAIVRGQDVHHRNATFRGIADMTLLARHRIRNLTLGGGFSIPTGRTVENPYLLGQRGIEHVHIQFGSGTFDPIVEASYVAPIREALFAGLFAHARVPLYENSRGFRAPPEISGGANVSHRVSDRLRVRAEVGVYRQGYGEWDGLRDENTGLLSTHASIGATYRSAGIDVRIPLSQRTLNEGDAFEQGPTVILSISALRRR